MLFENCKIKFLNKNNIIIFEQSPYRINGLYIDADTENTLYVDKNFQSGSFELRLREKQSMFIGKDNMYSSAITFWTSDGHAIIDTINNKCINRAKYPIVIGDHVWISHGVRVLKSSFINNGCVIGAGSIINKQFFETNAVIAGAPARVVKKSIEWKRQGPLFFN